MHHALAREENFDVRYEIAKAQDMSQFESGVKKIRERYEHYHSGQQKYKEVNGLLYNF